MDISGPYNGSVIVSHFSTNKWTFSTIFDPKYGMHPVSGHRDFGYTQNPNGSYTFYTRGVDRLTSIDVAVLQALTGTPFNRADALWTSFIEKIRLFVDQNGGSASRAFVEIERPDWQKVRDVLDGKAPSSTLSKDCPD